MIVAMKCSRLNVIAGGSDIDSRALIGDATQGPCRAVARTLIEPQQLVVRTAISLTQWLAANPENQDHFEETEP